MSHVVRSALRIAGCGVAAATAGCGGAAGIATASPTPTDGGADGSGDRSSVRESSGQLCPFPGHAARARVADLPSGGPALVQISDGRMNNTANTDQRGFANTGNTYRIEDDVVLDASTQTATADYPQLRDAAKTQFATVTTTSSPAGLGCQADEFVGTNSTGYSQVGIAFQDGDVIAVVLLVDAASGGRFHVRRRGRAGAGSEDHRRLELTAQSVRPRRSRNSCRMAPVTPQMTRPDAS